jgi:putative ABC transport system substrate-binding protein
MKRRQFITLIGGAAAAWPLAAEAQSARMRRIGVLMPHTEADPEGQARVGALREGLRKLGWTDGRNVRIDYRWAAGDNDRISAYAADLVRLSPDLIVVNGTPGLVALKRATQTLPLIFVQVSDPVGGRFVTTVAHPGGNITGFSDYEFAFALKWLELLKQFAPKVTHVAVVHDPANPSSLGFVRQLAASGSSFEVQVTSSPIRDAADVERSINAFEGTTNGGLIVLAGSVTQLLRDQIISLAARHRLPGVYPYRAFALSGGLVSYGVDVPALYHGAATYIDRILKGENPSDLPVQFATKFELVINLKTAKALDLDPPIQLLARTDEVIE